MFFLNSLQTTIQVSAFYKANATALDLERIARGAPKRSPSPDRYGGNWDETNRASHSGSVTPSISISSTPTPADAYAGMNYGAFPFDTHFRINTPRQQPVYNTYSPSYSPLSTSPALSGPGQFYPTSMDTMRAQFGTSSADARTRPYVPIQPRGEQFLSIGGRFTGDGSTPILGLSSKTSQYQPPTAAPTPSVSSSLRSHPYTERVGLIQVSFPAR